MALFDKFRFDRGLTSHRPGEPETVLIVGAGELGLALARVYAARGARLALCARDPDQVERARTLLADAGSDVFAAACDAAIPTQVREFVSATLEHFGALDVLVTCADGSCALTQGLVVVLQQLFWATYHPTMAALPHMRRRGCGRLVHVLPAGRLLPPSQACPAAAQSALHGFSAGLRAELAGDGVCVTTVTPGLLRDEPLAVADSLRGVASALCSLPVQVAAQRVVRAVDRGKAQCTLGAATRAALVMRALAPEFSARLTALHARLWPAPAEELAVQSLPMQPPRDAALRTYEPSWLYARDERLRWS